MTRKTLAAGLVATALFASPQFYVSADNQHHRVARQDNHVDINCNLLSATRLDCSADQINSQVSEVPVISVSGVARIELKGNTIHDGSGTLRAAQLANVASYGLTGIWLQNNGILSIEVGAFDSFGALEDLRVFGNGIASLDKDAFRGLTSLEKLYLNNNPIASLVSGLFRPFQDTLVELNLKSCPNLKVIEDGSLNALTNPVAVDMVDTPSQCAHAPPPDDSIGCVCADQLEGGLDGYCDSGTAATAAPVTAAPVTPAPTADDAAREDTDSIVGGKSGKKGKSGENGEGPNDREGAADSTGKGKKGKSGDSNPNDRTDGSGDGADRVNDANTGKVKKGKSDASQVAPQDRQGSGLAEQIGSGLAEQPGVASASTKKSKKAKQTLEYLGDTVSDASPAVFATGGMLAVLVGLLAFRSRAATAKSSYTVLPTRMQPLHTQSEEEHSLLHEDVDVRCYSATNCDVE